MIRRPSLPLALGAALAAALGCSETLVDTSTVRSFDRPVDLAFACSGRLRILGDNGTADPTDPVDFSAQPVSSCVIRSRGPKDDNAPVGQEDLGGTPLAPSMRFSAVAVQPTRGTITVVSQPTGNADERVGGLDFVIGDGDPLTPGHNSIAVGSLPIAIATDTAGCHMLTANAGSCDLSVIDVNVLTSGVREPLVRALPVMDNGAELLARPAAMVAADLLSPIGVACPAVPQGLVYIAYPDCHAVAAVDAATGNVVSSIRFDATGTPTVVAGGGLACPRQCGARDPITDGARPSSLDLARDDDAGFYRLAIGLDNRPAITVVDLDPATGLPFPGAFAIGLEGDIGVVDVSISEQIRMGGTQGLNDENAGDPDNFAQFVYAVADDATVRVAEVLVGRQECDTQIDPRFLYDEREPARMICFGVGVPGNPPRRALARGPGIQFLGQERPVAVTIVKNDNKLPATAPPIPSFLAGHFAFIALSNGFTAVANVDDDNYEDTYLPTEPLASVVALGMPHQLRDAINQRTVEAIDGMTGDRICNALPPTSNGIGIGGPRADGPPTRLTLTSEVAENKAYTLPTTHASVCENAEGSSVVFDLTYAAPLEIRERVFPDWRGLPPDEAWALTWEGQLSLDTAENVVDGPQIRAGLLDVAGGGIRLLDPSRSLCAAGVEPYDMVTLRGCDPARGDAQCGANETCYVHPDATIATGACLPTAQLEALATGCRDYLVSLRRYSIFEASAGVLRLRERRRALRTTPVEGCTSDAQCADLARFEATLASTDHPIDEDVEAPPYTYACEPDPSRAPGPNRCLMTCTSDEQCEAGTLCRGGHCLEGIVPAPECALGLQRYDLRASEAFVAIGERTGYLHPIIADPATDACVKDPTASPLLLGRFGLSAPACGGGEPGDVTPNPCLEPVEQAERVPDYRPGDCTLASNTARLQVRGTEAIRFQNPGMRLQIVDPTYPGDAMCRQDRGGTLGRIPTVFHGFQLRFRIQNGFSTLAAGARVVLPSNVVRGPDGTVWILDAGDIDDSIPSTPNLQGQLVRVYLNSPIDGVVLN